MRKILFKLLFSLSSFSGVIMFFLINRNVNLPFTQVPSFMALPENFVLFLKYLLVFIFVISLAKLVLYLGNKFLNKEGSIENIEKIKPIEGQFLPVYIGLFVIALSFNDGFTFQAVFLICILFILWLFLEEVSYFNPFFIFWGYRFYEIETSEKITSIIITKQKDVKKIKEIKNLTRLNNFTFLKFSND